MAISGGTAQNSSDAWTQHSTDSQVTLRDNEVSGVYDYQDNGEQSDTNLASTSTSQSSDTSTTAGWNDSVTSSDAWSSMGDQVLQTGSGGGAGSSTYDNNISESISVTNDYDSDDDYGDTLSGSSTTSSDYEAHSDGSGTYSEDLNATNGVTASFNNHWSDGKGTTNTEVSISDSGAVYDGWDDYSSGNDTWASYDNEQTYGGSSDGLGDTSVWSSTTQTLDGSNSLSSHTETSTTLNGGENDQINNGSSHGQGTVENTIGFNNTNGVSSNWSSTSYDGNTQWTGDNTYTSEPTYSSSWSDVDNVSHGWGSVGENSTTYSSTGSCRLGEHERFDRFRIHRRQPDDAQRDQHFAIRWRQRYHDRLVGLRHGQRNQPEPRHLQPRCQQRLEQHLVRWQRQLVFRHPGHE